MPSGDPPFKAVYPVTPSLVDWLTHRYEAIDQSTFLHFIDTYKLRQMVDVAESSGSRLRKFQARTAIDEYSDDAGSRVEYADIRDRVSGFIPSFEGEWVVFTDRQHDLLHMQDFSDGMFEDFLYLCPLSVKFVALWMVSENFLTVYRSPHIDGRVPEYPEWLIANGLRRDEDEPPAYVLEPQIEATIRQDLLDSMSMPTEDLMERQTPVARHVETVSIHDLLPL